MLHARTWRGAGGAPVVLVHGVLVSSRYMVRLGRALGRVLPVYAPDLPGFGRSPRPTGAPDVPMLADALAAWIESAELERPALLGNSFGCQVAVDLAVRRPELVSRLVLVGPTIDPAARPVARLAARWLLLDAPTELRLAPIIARDLVDMGPRYAPAVVRAMVEDRIEHKLPRVVAPTLVVRGRRDHTAPSRWVEAAAAAIPRGRAATLTRGGHAANYNGVDPLVRLVVPFLKG